MHKDTKHIKKEFHVINTMTVGLILFNEDTLNIPQAVELIRNILETWGNKISKYFTNMLICQAWKLFYVNSNNILVDLDCSDLIQNEKCKTFI